MSRDEQVEFARRILLRLLETRARSEQELRQAMARKLVPADIADELLQRFTEVGLVDDAAFAVALTNTRQKVGLQGSARIKQELRRKGVPDEVVSETLAAVDPEDELSAARHFAQKKKRSLTGLDPVVARRRPEGALARRGFSAGVVRQASREILGELEDEHLGEA